MKTARLLIVACLLLAAGVTALALRPEKPDLPPAALEKIATHIVLGTVRQIWARVEDKDSWETTHLVAELKVDAVEKGDGLLPDGLVYIRYWHREWTGWSDMPADTNGHRGLPAVGERVRVYLARNAYDGFGNTDDGGFNVVGANGFSRP